MPGMMETPCTATALPRVPPAPGRERDQELLVSRPTRTQAQQTPSYMPTFRWGLGAVDSGVQSPALPATFHTSTAVEEHGACGTWIPFAFTS